MKLRTEFNLLFLLGSEVPFFINDTSSNLYVLIRQEDVVVAPTVVNTKITWTLPYAATDTDYVVDFRKEVTQGYTAVTPGDVCFIKTNSTNKLVAIPGLNDTVYNKEICNSVNACSTQALVTGGLTVIGASLGLIDLVIPGLTAANVTVNSITDNATNILAIAVGDEVVKDIQKVLDKLTISGKNTVKPTAYYK